MLSAGRDVYGTTLQLFSAGNRKYDTKTNRPIEFTEVMGLPSQGAAITVMAGLNGKQPSYDAFRRQPISIRQMSLECPTT